MTDKYTYMDPVALLEEVRKLDARINNPITDSFINGVRHEAAHQVQRWGAAHDRGKTAFDWFWLIGYLAQKAATAAVAYEDAIEHAITPADTDAVDVDADLEKALHHTISTAAALLNWHAQLRGQSDLIASMRHGIDPASFEEG